MSFTSNWGYASTTEGSSGGGGAGPPQQPSFLISFDLADLEGQEDGSWHALEITNLDVESCSSFILCRYLLRHGLARLAYPVTPRQLQVYYPNNQPSLDLAAPFIAADIGLAIRLLPSPAEGVGAGEGEVAAASALAAALALALALLLVLVLLLVLG